MKHLCISTFVVLVALNTAWGNNNLILGNCYPPGNVLVQQEVYKKKDGLGKKHGTYEYDQQNSPNPAKITCIKVLDIRKENEGGSVEVENGGVKSTHVRLRFVSDTGKGYRFLVTIFGR